MGPYLRGTWRACILGESSLSPSSEMFGKERNMRNEGRFAGFMNAAEGPAGDEQRDCRICVMAVLR